MRYYPICLEIKGKVCIVVGGGEVAERKVLSLLNAGAEVKVVSPVVTERLQKISAEGGLLWIKRIYEEGDLEGAFLAYAASDNEDVNRRISDEAAKGRVLLNVVDQPEICDFIVPSVVERGLLTIAVSTGGASPAFARRMRLELEEMYGEEYAVFLEIMAAVRQKLLTKKDGSVNNRSIFNELASLPIPEMIRDGRWNDVDRTITTLLGEEFSLTSIGIKKGG